MSFEYHHTHNVTFAETDMAGIAHFCHFFYWMEETEHRFLHSLGISPITVNTQRTQGWPKKKATCQYLHPAVFQDALSIHLIVCKIGSTSIGYNFNFHNQNTVHIATGSLTTIWTVLDHATTNANSASIPDSFLDKIRVAPQSALSPSVF